VKVTDLIPWRSGSMPARRHSADPVGLLQTDINRLFDDFLQTMPLVWQGTSFPETADLKVNVSDTGKAIRVTAELPGMAEDSVDIRIDDNELVISGEKRDDREVEDRGFLLRERRYGRVERSIPLPEGLDSDAAGASFSNGVLTIEIPKGEDAKRISIRKS